MALALCEALLLVPCAHSWGHTLSTHQGARVASTRLTVGKVAWGALATQNPSVKS